VAINPTVAATEYAIGNGLTLSVTRPGAEDSTGVLFVVAVAFLGDSGAAPSIVAGSAGFTGLAGFAYNRMSAYGRYVGVWLYAKTGSATEAATFDITAGGADAPAPATTYKHRLVGSFALPSGQSVSATYPCPNVPLSRTCKFSIENGTAQNLTAGWLLKATPKTYAPVV
jgi:hypothetical protein